MTWGGAVGGRHALWGALLVLPLAVPAAGAAGSAPDPVALGRTTTVTVSSSGKTEVVLPRAVALSQAGTDNPSVRIETTGRHAGLALIDDARRDKTVAYVGWTNPAFSCGTTCPAPVSPYSVLLVNETRGDTNLPAGNYTLSVVTDGAPVKITLTFPELSGTASVEPTAPNGAVLAFPAARQQPVAGALVHTAGQSTDLAGDGLLFSRYSVVGDTVAGPGVAGTCLYAGPEQTGDHLPGCPTADDEGQTVLGTVGTRYSTVLTALTATLKAGPYGQGAYYTAVSDIDTAGLVTVALPY